MKLNNLVTGVAAVCVACACWAYAFVVPIFLGNYDATQIAIFRYLFYGVFSLVLFLVSRKQKKFPLKFWAMAFFLGLTGNVLYYYLLIIGINVSGPEIAIPIGGMMPVTVALLGNITLKEFPLRKIALPLLITFLGLLFINYTQIPDVSRITDSSLLGLAACFAALGLWSWYGVTNADFLKKHPEVDSSTWTNMIGIMSLLQVMLWGGGEFLFRPQSAFHFKSMDALWTLCLWTASLGVISSWLGTVTWNMGAKKLPVTLAGQFIVMEPVFGLIYVFLLKGELPRLLELAGFTICLAGILLTLRKIQVLRSAAKVLDMEKNLKGEAISEVVLLDEG